MFAQEPTSIVVVHLLVPATTIVLSVIVTAWLYRARWDVRGVRAFLLTLVVGGVLWQLQLVAHVLTADRALAEFIVVSEKITGVAVTLLWVVFVSRYSNSDFHRRRGTRALFALVLGGLVAFAATNPSHHLLMREFLWYEEPFAYSSGVRGPAYFLILALTYALMLTSLGILARFLQRTRRSVRPRLGLVGAGVLFVAVLNVTSILGYGPVEGFQYGGYGAFAFLLCTLLAVFRLGLLDIAPVARTTLVETLNDAVIVVDGDRRLVDYNREATSLWPSLSDHEGDALGGVAPDLAAAVDLPVEEARTSRITLSAGVERRHYSLLVSPVEQLRSGERVAGYSLLLRDVTELESSRRKLTEQNRRLDQVAATLSHDLRNPLNVAEGHVGLLEERLDDADGSLEAVSESHDRMQDIIDDVLTLARDGEDVTNLRPVDVEGAAGEAWENVDTGGATLEVVGSGTVDADRSRLLTIFENIYRNSADHAGDAPTVTVEVLEDGFAVADDGPGVDAHEADAVFEFGYTTSDAGTGLGLAIVRTLAEAHGWTVALDPEHDGARFVFSDVVAERNTETETGDQKSVSVRRTTRDGDD